MGLGTTQAKFYVALSTDNGRLAPHLNFGYTVSGKGDLSGYTAITPLGASDEVNYAGGLEFVAHRKLTIVGDLLGRTLIDAGNIRADLDDGSGTGTRDGAVTIEDLLFFLTHYDAGC